MEQTYIFLDRDGKRDLGLILLVLASTGIEYAVESAGSMMAERSVEGFIIPLGRYDLAEQLASFFHEEFVETPTPSPRIMTKEHLDLLRDILAEVTVWKTSREKDERGGVELDLSRLYELTAAWIPVISPYGPSVLVFKNTVQR